MALRVVVPIVPGTLSTADYDRLLWLQEHAAEQGIEVEVLEVPATAQRLEPGD